MPRLPPVAMSPQMRLRARFWPGLTHSTATFFQPHSSSSATSCARPVSVPCPISERAMRTTQVLSGLTTTQALTSVPAAVAASADPMNGSLNPSASPPPAAAELTMNLRRERLVVLPLSVFFMVVSSGFLRHVSGHVHARADALIGAAAVLRAGQACLLADDPQERRPGLHLHVADLAVDIEFCHERPPLTLR